MLTSINACSTCCSTCSTILVIICFSDHVGLMCWWIIVEGGFNYHEFNGEIDDECIKKLYKKGVWLVSKYMCYLF